MAFGNLFGKKKSGGSSVLTGNTADYQYPHHYGERKVEVRYDPTFQEREQRPAYDTSQRIVFYVNPVQVEKDGLPNKSEKNRLRKHENNLIRDLEKNGVDAKWVGTILHEGLYEVVFMTQSTGNFRQATKNWIKSSGLYRVEAMEGNGWEFFEKIIQPTGLVNQQVTDQALMDQLKKAGSNMEVGHWTEHLIIGPQAILSQLAQEMLAQEFYLKSREGDRLILEKCMKMEPSEFETGVLNLRVRCDQLGLDYDGWETAVVKDTVLSGTIKDGFGEYIWTTGLRYIGDWVGGERTGKGHMRFKDGSQYIGEFQSDKRTGHATMIWEYNEKYEGDFLKGEIHGRGTYYWPSGNKYTGEWYYGDRHGKGKFWWGTGGFYEGDFVQNKRTGFGRYEWPEGDWYEGEFLNGKLHGKGKEFIKSRQELREGEYVDGTYKGGRIISSGTAAESGQTGGGQASGTTDGNGAAGSPANSAPTGTGSGLSSTNSGSETSSEAGSGFVGSINLSKKPTPKLPKLSWKVMDDNDPEILDSIGREARFASAKGKKSFLFLSGLANGPAYDLRSKTKHPKVAEAFAPIQLLEVGGSYVETLRGAGFVIENTPCIFQLYPNGRFAGMQMSGFGDNKDMDSLAGEFEAFFQS